MARKHRYGYGSEIKRSTRHTDSDDGIRRPTNGLLVAPNAFFHDQQPAFILYNKTQPPVNTRVPVAFAYCVQHFIFTTIESHRDLILESVY